MSDLIYDLLGWRILAQAEVGGKGVYVVKKRKERVLVYDHVIHSELKNDSLYTKQYWDYFIPLPAVFEKAKVLVIGLGGGTMPYQIKKLFGNRVDIDVVEIDKEMVRLSSVFLPEKLDANIIINDGYAYLSDKRGIYDIIILDSYIGEGIPKEFFESAFVENAFTALKEDGILGINYAMTLKTLYKRRGFFNKIRRLFKVYLIAYPRGSGNLIVLCSKKFGKEEILTKLNERFPRDMENRFLMNSYSKAKELESLKI